MVVPRVFAAVSVATLTFLPASGTRADVPALIIDPTVAKIVASVSSERLRLMDAKLVSFGTRSTFSEKLGSRRGVFAARAWIQDQFRTIARTSGGRMTVALDSYVQKADAKRIPRDVEISSVIATLHGDDPAGRTYVISSHYDSRNSSNDDASKDAPGADDNGSGTVCVLEAARALAATPVHATVIFATFDSEEQGLLGAAHFVKTLKDAGVNVAGDLNNDIIGASVGDDGVHRDNHVRIFSEALPLGGVRRDVNLVGSENDSPSRELARFAKETGERYVPKMQVTMVYRADRFLRGGDHEAFNDAGFPAIRYVEPRETFSHQHQDVRVENGVQYGDLIDYVDFAYLARVTQMNIAALATLAIGPASPQSVQILTRELTNDTTLMWKPVPGAVTYEIVHRFTIEPEWSEAADVGNVSTATVKFSKDNFIFGVRSVDASGRKSVVAYPVPLR